MLCRAHFSKLALLVATALRYKRRDVLSLTLGGVAASTVLSAFPTRADPAPPAPASPPVPADPPPAVPHVAGPGVILAPPMDFSPSTPSDYARQLAKQPFKPISSDLPDPFRNLGYEDYAGIKLKPEARVWADETIGFIIEPRHRGFQYTNPIVLNRVADGKAYRLVYDVKLFDFGKLNPSPKVGDIGFSGFNVLSPQGSKGWAEIASFGGTNFFQGLAEGQVDGLMARALALKVLDPRGEEMPYFREMWIEKPSVVADLLVVHAVLDSDSVTGAFRFTIRPGEATIMDTECTLFPRRDLDNYGLASMSATHLLGFIDHGKFNDYRPNVDAVGGAGMLPGAGEWVWRPVSTRSHSGAAGRHRRYFVEFEGDVLGDAERTKGMTPTLTASAGSITFMRTFAFPERKAFRVLFELDPQGAPSSELRLVLEAGGKRISETWLYRWTPT